MKVSIGQLVAVILSVAAVHGLCSSVKAAPLSFSDGFEGASLNPFWTTTQHSGSVTFPSTAHVHSGSQSVQFNSTATGQDKFISLEHVFPHAVFGTFSVWAYDTGADVLSSNYIEFELDLLGTHERNSIFGNDYDFSGTYSLNPNDHDSVSTNVDRTQGWHQFLVDISPSQTTYKIDGTTVYTKPGIAMDHVTLFMGGPSWRPAFTTSFDDFSFRERPASVVPEPGSALLMGASFACLFGLPRICQLRRRNLAKPAPGTQMKF
jgi:hypothetical protein